jgi:hypothetical protein
MPQQLNDSEQVNPSHHQSGSEGMPQIVPVKVFDASFFEVALPIRVLDPVDEMSSN